jgi:hypothetical protein
MLVSIMPKTPEGSGILARYPELRRTFLMHLARYGNQAAACTHCRITREQLDTYVKHNPTFLQQMEAANSEHHAAIEEEIRRRAIDGVKEKRYAPNGEFLGVKRTFSDTLLLAYAKRHIKEYRTEGSQTVKVDATVQHNHALNISELTAEQRQALRTLLAPQPQQPAAITTTRPTTPAIPIQDAEAVITPDITHPVNTDG